MTIYNLPSLDGQQYYMKVYDVRHEYWRGHDLQAIHRSLEVMAKRCFDNGEEHRFNISTCDMQGRMMEVIHQHRIQDNIQYRVRQQFYTVNCSSDGKYYVTKTNASQYNLTIHQYSRMVDWTIRTSKNPRGTYFTKIGTGQDGIVFVLNSLYDDLSIRSARAIPNILTKRSTEMVDRDHTQILFNSTDMSDSEYLSAINSTYLNTLHNCETLCAQSIVSGDFEFLPFTSIEQYALLCMRGLLDQFPEKVGVPQIPTTQAAQVTAPQAANVAEPVDIAAISGGAISALLVVPCVIFGAIVSFGNIAFARNIRRRICNMFAGIRRVPRSHDKHVNTQTQEPEGTHMLEQA